MDTTSLGKQETNPLKRLWISFWFHDVTRLLLIMFGGHLAVTVPLLYGMGLTGEALRTGAMVAYVGGLVWALTDSDYENLYRIGLDVYRKPLKALQSPRVDPHMG